MLVLAIKLTDDPDSTKIVYEKDEKLFIRSGEDGFKTGQPVQTSLTAIINKWGFRRVDNPPTFKDADDLIDHLDNFAVTNDGVVNYHK